MKKFGEQTTSNRERAYMKTNKQEAGMEVSFNGTKENPMEIAFQIIRKGAGMNAHEISFPPGVNKRDQSCSVLVNINGKVKEMLRYPEKLRCMIRDRMKILGGLTFTITKLSQIWTKTGKIREREGGKRWIRFLVYTTVSRKGETVWLQYRSCGRRHD